MIATACGREKTLTKLLQISYPIIQAGMVYCSGGKLAAAAAKSGCLGLIGAGSMKPPLLKDQIIKAKSLTDKSIGVNIPLLYPHVSEQIDVALKEGIKIFFTSAGSPKKYTSYLKEKGCIVVHVVSSPALAKKCEDAGVDAVVAEGFEAGGHNGREEITTMVLIPQVCDAVKVPVIAAGGIAGGNQIAAALCLGASGVQIGTRFAATVESSAHLRFKETILKAGFGDTRLMMKSLVPVRLLDNPFAREVYRLEKSGASPEVLKEFLGKGRAGKGMLEGDLEQGELEIGQVSAMVKDIPTCSELVQSLVRRYRQVLADLK